MLQLVLLEKLGSLLNLIPELMNLYTEILEDGEITSTEAIQKLTAFLETKFNLFSHTVSKKEFYMLVCGVLGVFHSGDSSNLYDKLTESV